MGSCQLPLQPGIEYVFEFAEVSVGCPAFLRFNALTFNPLTQACLLDFACGREILSVAMEFAGPAAAGQNAVRLMTPTEQDGSRQFHSELTIKSCGGPANARLRRVRSRR
jgi:hypothetical protein